jgi:hypothetical protein
MDQLPVMSADDKAYRIVLLNSLRNQILAPVEVRGNVRSKMHIFPEEYMDEILDNNIELFEQSFTHESFDYERNYEKLETIGDLSCNLTTGLIITEHYPNLDQAELSNMLGYYKSNREFAAGIASAIPNIETLIRVPKGFPVPTYKILGDVFEALVRVVFIIGDRIIKGAGYGCAENMYRALAIDFIPDKKYAQGNPKTLVTQAFGKAAEEPPKGTFYGFLTVKLDNAKVDEVGKIMDISIPKSMRTFTNAVAIPDRKKASMVVYSTILNNLKGEGGFTIETYEEKKRLNTIKDYNKPQKGAAPKYKGSSQDIFAKEKDRDEKVMFVKTKSYEGGMLDWKLVGRNNKTGKRRLIAMVTTDKSSEKFHITKDELLSKYLEEGRLEK